MNATPGADPDHDEEHWNAWLEAEQDRDRDDAHSATSPSGAASEGGDDVDDGGEVVDDEGDDEPPSAKKAAPDQVGPAYPLSPCTLSVRQGDCVLSIARRYRLDPKVIWEHPNNAELRRKRDVNVLLPGDALFVPEWEPKFVERPTGRLHRFVVRSRPEHMVTLRFMKGGAPRAGVPYTLTIDGATYEGETDGDGRVRQAIAADARAGEITLHDAARDERYPVRLGHLNPTDDLTGVQARLNHLGFSCGPVDGELGPRTRAALRMFQRARKLEVSGEVDDATRAELRKAHGS